MDPTPALPKGEGDLIMDLLSIPMVCTDPSMREINTKDNALETPY